jgi:hypothetical protein
MWEIPNEAALREKERYMADVNYIPPSSNTNNENVNDVSESREQTPETDNNNIIDDTMVDYLFSAFDRKKEDEAVAAAAATTNYNEDSEMDRDTATNRDEMNNYDAEPSSNLSTSKEDEEPYSDAYADEGSTLDNAEVDQLLLRMGIESRT